MSKVVQTFFVTCVLLATLVIASRAQQLSKASTASITAKLFVINIPENPYAPGVIPPEGSYQVITFIVIKSKEEDLEATVVKLAYYGSSADELKIGDQICANFHPTSKFRVLAKDVFHDFGYVIAEEFLADFVFDKLSSKCA